MTVLITPQGKVFTFYIAGLALEYQAAYGGVIVTNTRIETPDSQIEKELDYV